MGPSEYIKNMSIIRHIFKWWHKRDPMEIKVNGIVVGRITKWDIHPKQLYHNVVDIGPIDPSILGKTTLNLQMTKQAIDAGHPIAFIDTEAASNICLTCMARDRCDIWNHTDKDPKARDIRCATLRNNR